jgi:hypothetical protein
MKKLILLANIIIIATIFYIPVSAEQIRELSWDDLVPAHLRTLDPLANVTEKQKDLVIWGIRTAESLPERGPKTEKDYKELDKAKLEMKEFGIDFDWLMAKREEVQTAVVEELNDKRVRIPGYLLPLETSGSRVTEFLLVPYVGACVHVPPPPPNQIVYVKISDKKGHESKRLFEPVWVSGVISAKSMTKDLYLTDGWTEINLGYAMRADRVEPYQP